MFGCTLDIVPLTLQYCLELHVAEALAAAELTQPCHLRADPTPRVHVAAN